MSIEEEEKIPQVSISQEAIDWYNGKTELGYYNFNLFTTTECVIQTCKDKYGVEVSASELDEMCEAELLDFEFDKKNGKKMLPLFMADRVSFIKTLKSKHNYDTARLRQIARYENHLLPLTGKASGFYYADRRYIYPWLIDRIKVEMEGKAELLKSIKIVSKDDAKKEDALKFIGKIKEQIAGHKELISCLENKKWKDFADIQKCLIVQLVYEQQFADEIRRKNEIQHLYSQVMHGYSPQVDFLKDGMCKDEQINWWGTLWNLSMPERYVDFFSTKSFSLEVNGKEVVIKIKEPENASSSMMRTIEKIYTIFKKRIGCKRKKWGEVSGRRELIKERDEELRRLYAQWRKEKPNVASARLIEQIEAHSEKLGMPVRSIERIKRILYSGSKS